MADRADAVTPAGTTARRDWPAPGWIGVVAVVQVVVLGWLLIVPLPVARNTSASPPAAGAEAPAPSEHLRRGYFLLAIDDLIAEAASNLRGIGHLTDRIPLILATALIAGAAISLGALVLRLLRLSDRFPTLARFSISYGLGVTLLSAITLGAGRMGWLDPWPSRLGLGVLILIGLAGGIRDRLAGRERDRATRPPRSIGPRLALGLILGPVLVLMALGAMQPTIEYDALEYHLQGPKEHYQTGRIAFLPHNVYTSMPSAVEMLHLLGMTVLDDWWRGAMVGQLLIAAFAPASAVMIAQTFGHCGSARAAWFSALIYLTTPWIYRLAVYPFVEGPLCFYHAALVYVAALECSTPRSDPDRSDPQRARISHHPNGSKRRRGLPLAALLGLLAGGAMACKYPGLVSAVVPFGLVAVVAAWRSRSPAIVGLFAVGVAIAVGPWLIRNLIDTGNPVYPLAFDLFGGKQWSQALDAKWWRAHGPRPMSAEALSGSLLDVAGRSDWQSPLYLMLAPLALVRPGSRRFAAFLAGYGAYLFGTWFFLTHRLDRFWLPMLPAAAVLAGLGADWSRRRSWTAWLVVLVGLTTATNLALMITPLSGPTDWTAPLDRLRREVPEAVTPSLARLDAMLPPEARPLIIGQAGVFHVRHPVVYNTVFNPETIEAIAAGRSPEQVARELRQRGITHIYVDWTEIQRHRKPGGYGFTPFVTRALFDDLVRAGVLSPPVRLGPDHLVYQVRSLSDTRETPSS